MNLEEFGYFRRIVLYLTTLSFFIASNLLLALIMWNKFDLSINFAWGFITLMYIIGILYNWSKDEKIKDKLKKEEELSK